MIYFDHAATSFPKNPIALNAILYAGEHFSSSARGSYPISLETSRMLFKARQKVCRFVGCEEGICVFTSGTTSGLNMVIQGLFHSGDHVLTTVLEHNSVLRPLYKMQEKGVEISIIDCDDEGYVSTQMIAAGIQENTKALIITMVSNVLGTLQEIKGISKVVHQHGMILIVDGAQALGNVPISMKELGIDILAFSGHKGLGTPIGIGAIVMNKTYSIDPLILGGSGFHSFDTTQPLGLPEQLEAGSQPTELIYALSQTIDHFSYDRYARIKTLTDYFIKQVQTIPNIRIVGRDSIGIVSIDCEGFDSEEVANKLYEDKEICVRAGFHCAPLVHRRFNTETKGLVRFSFSIKNTFEEIDEAILGLRQLMEEASWKES